MSLFVERVVIFVQKFGIDVIFSVFEVGFQFVVFYIFMIWYKLFEFSKCFGIFYFGNFFVFVFGGIVVYGM